MIYVQLRKASNMHLAAGIALSVIIVCLIALFKYEKNLNETIAKLTAIQSNTAKLNESMAQMGSAMNKIDSLLPAGYSSLSHRELLLLTLDGIKSRFSGSEVTVTNFEEKGGVLSLPVHITFPVNNYTELVNRVRHLQSLALPNFRLNKAVIEKTQDKNRGGISGIICSIEGTLIMPNEHLKANKR